MLKFLRSGALAAVAAALCCVGTAHSELPTSKLVAAPLISPTQAWSYYDSVSGGMTRTTSVVALPTVAPEIQALARSLGAERVSETGLTQITPAAYAQNVYDYVRNNIATEFRFGLGKGARGALIDQSGTPFDQADLMAALLRQGGVAPVYKVGSVQLSAQQVGAWTGMIRTFSTGADGAQTVTVNARALCQYLADGAIPATFSIGTTAVSSCASLSGDLSASDSVTIGHIWIEAAGLVFDPSFKKLRFTQGLDLNAAMGCGTTSCGANAVEAALRSTSGTGFAVSSTFGGKPALSNINETALNSQLKSVATNLENYLKANAPNATIEQLVGGREIDLTFTPTPATSPTNYAARYSWSGQIPDGFRSFVTVPTSTTAKARLFGDELSGQRLMFSNGIISTDNVTITSNACGSTVCNLTLDVNHPYASNCDVVPFTSKCGVYGDDTVNFVVSDGSYNGTASPVIWAFVVAWGDSSNATESHFSALQRARPIGLFDPSTVTAENCFANCGGELPTIGATVLKSQSMASKLIDRVTNGETTRHHTLGLVVQMYTSDTYKAFSRLNLHSNVSANSHTADASERAASFEIGALVGSTLEGGLRQYATDSYEQASAEGMMAWANRAGQKFIDVAPGGVTSALTSALSGYSSGSKTRLQARAAEGYGFVLPQNDTAGSVSVTGGSATALFAGAYLYRPSNTAALNGDDGGQAPLINLSQKGGSGTLPADPAQIALRAVKDGPTNAKQKLAVAADPATGAVNLSATDLVTGTGDFPNSLPFQRFYNSSSGTYEFAADGWWTYEGADDTAPLHMPNGWTHNYSYAARIGASFEGAVGEQGGLGASSLVAGLHTLFTMRDSIPFERRLTSLFVGNWMSDQINGNAVIMSEPTSATVFIRLPSGNYLAPLGSQSRLVVTGARTGPYLAAGQLIYDYSNVQMSRTFADGSVMSFLSQEQYKLGSSYFVRRTFRPMDWVFPGGMKVKFNYREELYNSQYDTFVLDSVSNSLGRKLTILSTPVTLENASVHYRMWRVSGVKDENNRTVSYAVGGCPASRGFICDTLSVTGTDAKITKYDYAADDSSPNPTSPTRVTYRLRRVYPPTTPTVPIQTVVYDEVLRASSITDGNQHKTRVFAGSVVGTEVWKRAETVSPRLDVLEDATIISDARNNPILLRNALGNSVTNSYDPMGRLIRSEQPEHNATEFAYDLRGNVLSTCDIPKERTGQHCDATLGDITSFKSYVEGETTWWCANLASCNKVASETNPLNNVTQYNWNATDGFLNWVEGPSVDGGNARTDLDYKTYPIDGDIKFLWHKTDRVAGSQSIITLYDYDATKKYALKSATSDSTGVAATICFYHDDFGRLTSVTDPRAGACQ